MATLLELAASSAVGELGAAPATPVAGSSLNAVADAVSPPARKRARAPRIDIDTAILKHMDEIKRASKLVNDARRAARNERRRKSRLMKKAATLTPEDLERIAVLKRCGLYNPAADLLSPSVPATGVATAPSSTQQAAPDALAAPPNPANIDDPLDDGDDTEDGDDE